MRDRRRDTRNKQCDNGRLNIRINFNTEVRRKNNQRNQQGQTKRQPESNPATNTGVEYGRLTFTSFGHYYGIVFRHDLTTPPAEDLSKIAVSHHT